MARVLGSTDPDLLERQMVRREDSQVVHEEVDRLPRSWRTAVVLCDLEGRPREEVAHLLRCSERTLRRRLGRAHDLLRARLTRRGLAPLAGLLAAALGREPALAAIPQITVNAIARAAICFAAGRETAGIVPASATALADAVITAMIRTKLKAIAFASGVFAVVALGAGVGIRAGIAIAAQDRVKPAESKSVSSAAAQAKQPSPAEQYRALMKDYDLAMAAFNKLGENAKTQEEREAAYKGHHLPEEDFNPRFLALAERYPNDPVAAQSLIWIVEQTMRYWDGYNQTRGDAIGRTMEILARDHLTDARMGALCLKLTPLPLAPARRVPPYGCCTK